MNKGLLGIKVGMTQIFDEEKHLIIPVTVISAFDNIVLQQKTIEKDGYIATKIGMKEYKKNNKPQIGIFAKNNIKPLKYIKEFTFKNIEIKNKMIQFKPGEKISIDLFQQGEFIDVTAFSKGKGFSGSIKRHNQHRGPMTHGSRFHRRPGSMGPIKGKFRKNLPGRMGNEKTTLQNLKIVRIDLDNKFLMISGSIPGPKKGLVVIKNAVKKVGVSNAI